MKALAILCIAFGILCSACAHKQNKADSRAVAKENTSATVEPSYTKEEAQVSQAPVYRVNSVMDEDNHANSPDSLSKVLIKIIGFLVFLSAGACVLIPFLKGASLQGLGLSLSKAKPSELKIKETRLLGNKQFLMVVEYEGQKMLLGTSPSGLQYLCKLDSPDLKRSEIMKV